MAKVGPNEPCPCGSGRKAKKCCGAGRPRAWFNEEDRTAALAKLAAYAHQVSPPEERQDLADEFWDDLEESDDPDAAQTSQFIFLLWWLLDVRDEDGLTMVQAALREPGLFTAAERSFLQGLSEARIRPYVVTHVVPGESVTLKDALTGVVHTVHELLGSHTLQPGMTVATRVIAAGVSGRPEMEGGILPFRPERVRDVLEDVRELESVTNPGWWAAGELAPVFHDAWLRPAELPRLVDGDGNQLVETQVVFDVLQGVGLSTALDRVPGLEREEPGTQRWTWTRPAEDPLDATLRGWIERRGKRLILETMSRERAEEGRRLLEEALGASVAHRFTEASDLRAQIERSMEHDQDPEDDPPDGPPMPPEVREQLEAMLSRHYRRWLDEPIPMFDGLTPRDAVKGPLRARVVAALDDFDRSYQRARAAGEPAFDPAWLREQLGL